MELNLERIRAFADRAGFLQSVPFKLVHVVGTNGKGSTASFVESLARATNLQTGLYGSPHLVTFRERVRVNGRMLPESAWLDVANAVWEHARDLGLTYFEFLTACAVAAFSAHGIDLAVLEAGLGGTWDATSVFPADVLLVTSIGLDHQHVLGDTLAEIATDKGGAMKPGQRVFCAPQEPEAAEALRGVAAGAGAHLAFTKPLDSSIPLGLAGPHQRINSGLALAGWRSVMDLPQDVSLTDSELRGLAHAFLPGRMQRATLDGKDFILDAAHNVPALEALATGLQLLGILPESIIFTCLKDKELEAMAPIVARLTNGPILVPELDAPRARPASEVAEAIRMARKSLPPNASFSGEGGLSFKKAPHHPAAVSSLSAALQSAPGPVLVCGSLYLLGALYTQRPSLLHL